MHKKCEMVMELNMSSPAAVHPGLGPGLSATTLDFGAPVESIAVLSFPLFYLLSFVRSSPPLHSVSQRTYSQTVGRRRDGGKR